MGSGPTPQQILRALQESENYMFKDADRSERGGARHQLHEPSSHDGTAELLRELVSHLRQDRTQLREEWSRRITEAQLLAAMSKDEIFAEATAVYDQYVEALETGTFEALQAYARSLSERIIPRGVETHEVVGIVLLLRDVLARSLFAKYRVDFRKLDRILDAYEPAANRIQERLNVLKGTFRFDSELRRGTKLSIAVPLGD